MGVSSFISLLVRTFYLPVENHCHGEQESCRGAGCLSVWKSGNDHVREGAGKDKDLNAKEQDQALAFRGLDAGQTVSLENKKMVHRKSLPEHWVVVADENKDTEKDLIKNLDNDVRKYESNP